MKTPIHQTEAGRPKARYELRLTVEANWEAEDHNTTRDQKLTNITQVMSAVRHHLQQAKIPVIAICPAAYTRKKIVQTLRGESLPPVTKECIDDSRNAFEVSITPETGLVQLYIEQAGGWVELAWLEMLEPDNLEEPDHNDTVLCCPNCERPNQFGELCESCARENKEAI